MVIYISLKDTIKVFYLRRIVNKTNLIKKCTKKERDT